MNEVMQVVLPAGNTLSDWSVWSQRTLMQAVAAGATDLHIDFVDQCPIDVRAVAVLQDLVGRWSEGDQRCVRLENLDHRVHRSLAFLGMCDAPDFRLPLTASVDSIGQVRIVPMNGVDDDVLAEAKASNWIEGLIVDEVKVDMRHVDQMGSRFINWLLILQTRIPCVELYKVTPRVEEVLRRMRLDKLFPIRPQTAVITAG